jgi:hypothetical protein
MCRGESSTAPTRRCNPFVRAGSTAPSAPGIDPVDAEDFRRLALALSAVVEGAHLGHPDFRVGGRIFATIHHDHRTGMVKLTPAQQQDCLRDHPRVFSPESGAWGRAGCTRVNLAAVDEETLGAAMTQAWQNIARGAAKPPRRRRRT